MKKNRFALKMPKIKIDLKRKSFSKLVFIPLVLLVVGFLGYRFKDRFLAGMVNDEPIFRFQLSGRLNSLYGRQVLEDLIVEKLIYQEAKIKKISISADDLKEAYAAVEKQLGPDADLNSILAFQGVQKSDFERQLKTQILVKKIVSEGVSLSDEEIDKFIKENKGTLTATEGAELIKEAKDRLMETKIAEKVNPWVSELVNKAKVQRFLR